MGIQDRREREKIGAAVEDPRRGPVAVAKEGYEAVSMRRIAEAIEYSATAIYVYFADKDALIRELCREDFGALAGVFRELAAITDPVERVCRVGEAYVDFGTKYPNHYRLMFMTAKPMQELDETDRAIHGQPDQDAYAFLRQAVREAIEQGRLRPGIKSDADLITQTLWAAVHGVVGIQLTHEKDIWIELRPLKERTRLMVSAIQNGLFIESSSKKKVARRPLRKVGAKMNFVALKMLIGDRMKYLSLVAGLAFASLLVTQQASIFTGYSLRTGAWLRDTGVADLWVFDEQAEFADDFKLLLDTSLNRVRGIEGVRWAPANVQEFRQRDSPGWHFTECADDRPG